MHCCCLLSSVAFVITRVCLLGFWPLDNDTAHTYRKEYKVFPLKSLASDFNVTTAKSAVGSLRVHCWPQSSLCISDACGFVTFPLTSDPFLASQGACLSRLPSERSISGNGLSIARGPVCRTGERWVYPCRVRLQPARPCRCREGVRGCAAA